MAITDLSNLTQEQQAAAPVTPSLPFVAQQPTAGGPMPTPNAPVSGVPGPVGTLPAGVAPPEISAEMPGHAEKIGTIAAQVPTPPGPGGWAKKLVASASSALQSMQTGLGAGLQDYANATPAPNSGILGGLAAEQNARAQRIQGQRKEQDQHSLQVATINKINADTYHQQVLNHRESGDYNDKVNNEAIATGKEAVNAATLNAVDAGLDPSKVIHSNVTEQEKQALLTSKGWNPNEHTVWETGSQPVIDPATGKPKTDEDGSKQYQKLYTIIDTPDKIVLNAKSATLLNTYLHSNWKAGDILPGGPGLAQFQLASNAHALQSDRDAQLAKIDESAANAQQKLAMDRAQENLGNDFLQVVSGLPSLNDQLKFVSGQHMVPDPTGKNPNGVIDPRSAAYAQKHPNAPNDLIDSYGGKQKFQALVVNEAKEAETERKNRADEAEKKIEDLKKQNDSGSWSLQENADGVPVLLNSKNGQTMPAPAGVQPRGTKSKQDAAFQKESEPAIAALGYANSYLSNGIFTGSGDEALQEKFFELAKPTTGFRMSQPQMDMLQNSRNWMGSAEAKSLHAATGQWFSPEQRKQIVGTMQQLANSKLQALHGNASTAPTVTAAPEGHQVKLQSGGTATKKGGKWINDQTGQEVK